MNFARTARLLRLPLCTCPPLRVQPPALLAPPFLTRGYAKKKDKSRASEPELEEEVHSKEKKGKGKGKGAFVDDTLEGSSVGAYESKSIAQGMDSALERLSVALRTVVGRVGRVSPDLLDGIKVESEGQRRPLAEFASVTVKDGRDLIVSVYEESAMKFVSAALYASPLSLTPQQTGETTLKVPIARPDWDKRQLLVKQAAELCENARVAIRATRGKGQKDIKLDLDGKVIGKEEARTEGKALDTTTKKRTDEVDTIFERAKKVLMDE